MLDSLGGRLTRLFLFVIGVWIAARIARSLLSAAVTVSAANAPRPNPGQRALVQDPVCHVFVAVDKALALPEPGGTLYFCSPACRDRHRTSYAS